MGEIFKNQYGKISIGTKVKFEVENQNMWGGDLEGILIKHNGEFCIKTERSGILEIDKWLSVYGNTIQPF
jgi:hypothetical protein